MNQVASVNGNTTSANPGLDQAAISNELEAVLEALHPRKDGAKQMERGKVTEEQLFAAFAVSELRAKNPTLADKVLKELQSHFKKFKESGDPKPIFKAIEKSLEAATKKGSITKAEAKEITAKALGMAQVDNRHDRLGSRYIKFVDKGEVPASTTYMDRMLNTVAKNSEASAQEIKSIKTSFEKAKEKGLTYGPDQKKARLVDYQGVEKPKVTTTSTEKKSSPELDTPAKTNDGSEVRFSFLEFGYKPKSYNDGKALIQIPYGQAKHAESVEIVDNNGNVIAKSPLDRAENDGQRIARFNKVGNDFGSSFTVRVNMVDGSKIEERVEDASRVYSRVW